MLSSWSQLQTMKKERGKRNYQSKKVIELMNSLNNMLRHNHNLNNLNPVCQIKNKRVY